MKLKTRKVLQNLLQTISDRGYCLTPDFLEGLSHVIKCLQEMERRKFKFPGAPASFLFEIKKNDVKYDLFLAYNPFRFRVILRWVIIETWYL